MATAAPAWAASAVRSTAAPVVQEALGPQASAPAQGEGQGEAVLQKEAAVDTGSWLTTFWKVANFVLLIGALVYFLKSPVGTYFRGRHTQIRQGLADAASLRTEAESRLAEVRARLAELPGELDALTRRGREELALEERRLAEATAGARQRLLERTHRDIDARSQLARRELMQHTATLAVQLARRRIERDITADDQVRLIDRYATEVRP